MIEKAKRSINLGKKECLVCGEEFQPASGAQRTCSPECKAKAKAQGLSKRGPKKRGGVDPAVKKHPASSLDRVQKPHESTTPPGNGTEETDRMEIHLGGERSTLPNLEFDLTPLENWMRAVVHQLVEQEVRGIVEEVLREKFKGLLGK